MWKMLLVVGLVMALAGCGVPDNLPSCNKNAPPYLTEHVYGWTADTSDALEQLGWVHIVTDSGNGIVRAECHLSEEWKDA